MTPRLIRLALSVGFIGILATRAHAGDAFLHVGCADPEAEGWVVSDSGAIPPAFALDDGCAGAWRIADTSASKNREYRGFVATNGGFRLSARLRVVADPNLGDDAAQSVAVYRGGRAFQVNFGLVSDGRQILRIVTDVVPTWSGPTYLYASSETLLVVIDSADGATATVYVNGSVVLTGYAGQPYGGGDGFFWGKRQSSLHATADWSLVRGEIAPIAPDTDHDGWADAEDSDPAVFESCQPRPNPCFVCDDDDACTTNAWSDGECVFTPQSCDDDNPCTTDACDPATGLCSHSPVVCPDDGNACTSEACNATGMCVSTAASCDDGDPCTLDYCSLTDGCSHWAKCEDGIPCTVDVCVTGECIGNVPDHARCTNGAYCDGEESCEPANDQANGDGCVAGDSPCGPEGCLAYTCDEEADECLLVPSPFCTDDDLVCNGVPICSEQTAMCEANDVPDCSLLSCPAGQTPVCAEDAYALTGDPCICEWGSISDQDGNGIPDVIDGLCPCKPTGNHGEYVSCVASAVNDLRRAEVLDADQGGSIVSMASRSRCRM